MPLGTLKSIISAREPFRGIRKAMKGQARLVAVEELAPPVKPVFAAALAGDEQGPVAVVAYSQEEADRLWEGLIAYGFPEDLVTVVPAADSLLFEDGEPDWDEAGARINGLTRLALGQPGVLIMPLTSALRRTVPKDRFRRALVSVRAGQTLNLRDLARTLAVAGYRRDDLVTEVGQFSLRGGLLDVWPPTARTPVRIEMFDDEVESIRPFDAESQRSEGSLESVTLPPAREALYDEQPDRAADILQGYLDEQVLALQEAGRRPDADALEIRVSKHIAAMREASAFNGIEYYLPCLTSETVCLLDWLPPDALVIWDEPHFCQSNLEQRLEELADIYVNRASRGQALGLSHEHHVPFEAGRDRILKHRTLVMSSLPHNAPWLAGARRFTLPSGEMETFGSQVGVLAENVKAWVEHDQAVVIVTPQVLRVGKMLLELGVRPIHGELKGDIEPGVWVIEGNLDTGFRLPGAALVVVSDADIFGSTMLRRPKPSHRDSKPITAVSEISEGDFIVHEHHGIGVYRGMVQLSKDYGTREFLLLEYSGGDRLYVPADQMDRVRKYSGADSGPPTVHRLGGADWARTRKKVKRAVREMARELLQVYAAREALGGYGYPPDQPWQAEMEQAFPFRETRDQERAIADVKRDMEIPKPMDRLICGDVGFGKTEVAMRAAFKVVLDGRQVAVLCPTTVLAQQHHNVFSERFGAFPVKVEMLSRFRSPAEQRAILDELKAGNIDVIIGTHRLLSKDVEFKDLGLIVVDEEQRFGVTHKERLKQIRLSVDVLTLTATPIPRTLHMSLSGLRDMSVVNEAPEGRIPVRTYVREYDDELVREAIVRELDRDGQVYLVHNRVESITRLAERVAKLVPHARLAIGHGQMSEHELEKVMLDFYHHRFDVLVCTTIIESGLDVPTANTIVINNADKLGLAQLYQLRGRVGRSDRQAYAYLLYKSDLILSEVAERRLGAIREFADLGSGFKVAMRDLEIRGAGNILGPEQHGQMISVGFDMYCHLLAEAVREIKGEQTPEEPAMPQVDLSVEAYIPERYIPHEHTRIGIYRKMAVQRTMDDISRLDDELRDRFGAPPEPVEKALALLRLKVRCRDLGVRSVTEDQGRIVVTLEPPVQIREDALRQLSRTFREHWWEARQIRLQPPKSDPLAFVDEFLSLIERSLARPERLAGSARRVSPEV